MPEDAQEPRRLLITSVLHDLLLESSTVELTWVDSLDMKLWLPVPFGCRIDDLAKEAGKAIDSMPTGRVAIISPTLDKPVDNDDRGLNG